MAAQAEQLVERTKSDSNPPRILLRDQDRKLSGNKELESVKSFDRVLKKARIRAVVLPLRSPNLSSCAERFIQTLQHECLDRFVVLGTKHLDYLNLEFVDYYNRQRPHSSLEGHMAPSGPVPDTGRSPDDWVAGLVGMGIGKYGNVLETTPGYGRITNREFVAGNSIGGYTLPDSGSAGYGHSDYMSSPLFFIKIFGPDVAVARDNKISKDDSFMNMIEEESLDGW